MYIAEYVIYANNNLTAMGLKPGATHI